MNIHLDGNLKLCLSIYNYYFEILGDIKKMFLFFLNKNVRYKKHLKLLNRQLIRFDCALINLTPKFWIMYFPICNAIDFECYSILNLNIKLSIVELKCSISWNAYEKNIQNSLNAVIIVTATPKAYVQMDDVIDVDALHRWSRKQ